MPNWVYNTLTVEGNPDMVKQLKEQMNKPYKYSIQALGDLAYGVEEKSYSNPIFSFWNIVSPPADKIDEYHGTHGYENGEKVGETEYNWYNWNNSNWGVKWDVAVSDDNDYSNTELIHDAPNGENHVLVYRFDTPWGIPDQALIELSSQYPALLFTLNFEEETGWGGEDEFLRGEHIEGAGWNWKCPECDYMEAGNPDVNYCEDCETYRCPSCGYGDWLDDDVECQTHGVQSESKGE